jgi:heme exporter protein C
MAATMFLGMMLVVLGFWMYSIAVSLYRVRTIILRRERHTDWVADYMRQQA